MSKKVEKKQLCGFERAQLAYQTCQWWNAVFVQEKRFRKSYSCDHWIDPWDSKDQESIFLSERYFLIATIHHALCCLRELSNEPAGDPLKRVAQSIDSLFPKQEINDLRNMNEHSLDYLYGAGLVQDRYIKIFEKDGLSIKTTAALTIEMKKHDVFLFGNVEINKLLSIMKEQLPFVRKVTKEKFNTSMSKP